MKAEHWHIAVGGINGRPFTDLIIEDGAEASLQFLDFCQSFFFHDFEELSRMNIEAKMANHREKSEELAFQMSGSGYAALCYPCSECTKGSLN
jgi:hypothetical protein